MNLSMTSLASNGYTLSSEPHRLGRLEPSDPAEPLPALRERYRSQGYVWLKGFFGRREVLAMRRRFFERMAQLGLLEPGTDPEEGIDSGAAVDRGEGNKLLMAFVRSAAYEAFCLHPRLWQFYDAFFDGPSYLHKRKIVRYTRPGDTAATPAHYDLVYLRAGTDRVCSSWIPLGDIPVEMGGLVYLEGSDAVGRKLEAEFARLNAELPSEERISAFNKNMTEGGWVSKNLPEMAERFASRWLVADYEAGDMVVHSAYMIHAATTNQDPVRRIRLSTDIRYQRLSDEIDVRWTNHWTLDDML
jgi:ectoine hydroxylase-related dioxygenase (phytanoyl-CoA dioxygenase family)